MWTERGYRDHGPVDGPRQNIPGPQGGQVIATEKPYMTYDHLLYVIRWDDGHESKHYERELFSIGRFRNRVEFEAAVKIESPVTMTVGPRGGFRSAHFRLTYDGSQVESETYIREVWRDVLKPLAERDRAEVIQRKQEGGCDAV